MRQLPRVGRSPFIWALVAALLAVPASAHAQGRARLSDDLRHKIERGDTSDSTVIITATHERVEAIARRHGLRIKRPLATGAVLEVPSGALARVVNDPDLDQLSGDHLLHTSMDVTNVAIGADQAWETGLLNVSNSRSGGVTGKGIGVAIIDSGIDNLPALRDRIVASVDFTKDGADVPPVLSSVLV